MPELEANTRKEILRLQHSIAGCLLGGAAGDALGLPYEALSMARQRKLYPQNFDPGTLSPKAYRHRFVFGHGMVSDDTEHSCMAAQALIVSAGDPQTFAHSFAWRLRGWLLSLPPAIGFATLRALLKLWMGFPADRSGVFSAGNGPAMRSAILGVAYGGDLPRLRQLVRISTRVTHTDPKAEWSALAIAWAAHVASSAPGIDAGDFLRGLRAALGEDAAAAAELLNLLERAAGSASCGESPETFAASLGLTAGVSGYCYHTVPVVVQAWLRRSEDFSALPEIIRCGGDTDTTAAILGGLLGARTGKEGIPREWTERTLDWPRSTQWIERVGLKLAEVCVSGAPQPAVPLAVWALPLRSLVFTIIVLAHGARRLLPQY